MNNIALKQEKDSKKVLKTANGTPALNNNPNYGSIPLIMSNNDALGSFNEVSNISINGYLVDEDYFDDCSGLSFVNNNNTGNNLTFHITPGTLPQNNISADSDFVFFDLSNSENMNNLGYDFYVVPDGKNL